MDFLIRTLQEFFRFSFLKTVGLAFIERQLTCLTPSSTSTGCRIHLVLPRTASVPIYILYRFALIGADISGVGRLAGRFFIVLLFLSKGVLNSLTSLYTSLVARVVEPTRVS